MSNLYTNLPEAIFVSDIEDAGEYGGAICPHCGSKGRYIIHFRAADGKEYGAMKGCFSKFPKSRWASKMATLLQKEKDYAAKGWHLGWQDQRIMEIIREFAAGRIADGDASAEIAKIERKRKSRR